MNMEISYRDQNSFWFQAVNMFISVVKVNTLGLNSSLPPLQNLKNVKLLYYIRLNLCYLSARSLTSRGSCFKLLMDNFNGKLLTLNLSPTSKTACGRPKYDDGCLAQMNGTTQAGLLCRCLISRSHCFPEWPKIVAWRAPTTPPPPRMKRPHLMFPTFPPESNHSPYPRCLPPPSPLRLLLFVTISLSSWNKCRKEQKCPRGSHCLV